MAQLLRERSEPIPKLRTWTQAKRGPSRICLYWRQAMGSGQRQQPSPRQHRGCGGRLRRRSPQFIEVPSLYSLTS